MPAFMMLMSRWNDRLYMELRCGMHPFMMCEKVVAVSERSVLNLLQIEWVAGGVHGILM